MQQMIVIQPQDLLKRVARFKKDGCRLAQILCTRVPEGYELTYSFDKNYFLYNLRLIVPLEESIMSVTSQFWYAFVWENEIHDLFGLQVDFISPDVDYRGNFFQLAEKTPWKDLKNAAPPAQAIKVNLKPGLGVDASVRPAAKKTEAAPAAPGAKTPAAAADVKKTENAAGAGGADKPVTEKEEKNG